jgi:hypothetical protein
MGLEGEFAPQIAELAGRTEIARLIRPRHPFCLEELTDLLEQDFA